MVWIEKDEGHLVQSSCNEQGHLQLYQVAQSLTWPDLGHFQGYIKCVYSDLNRPILSSYTTPQAPPTSSHLLAQEPVLHQGDWAPPVPPHPPLQGHTAQLWLLFRPSQTGQNLPTSACKNTTEIGSNLSFREQHSLYRKRDLTQPSGLLR